MKTNKDRMFEIAAYHGENNGTLAKASVKASTPADASVLFCERFGFGNPYLPLRWEQPVSNGDRIFSVWSVGAPTLGQRIWIKESV